MIFCDLHSDIINKLWKEPEQKRSELKRNEHQLDLERMRKSGYLLQCFAAFTDSQEDGDPYDAYCSLRDVFKAELAVNHRIIRQVVSTDEMLDNERLGLMSALLTVEEGAVANTPERLRRLFEDGVRMITLTWNHVNCMGWPNLVKPDGSINTTVPNTECGLTKYGLETIEQMESYGIRIDCSHLSDAGFYDVYNNTKKPFACSHSNARAVWNHTRNITDDMIKKLAERGGIIGINFEQTFLGKHGNCGFDAVLAHVQHIWNVGGEDCLAFGTDFDGIPQNPCIKGVQAMPDLLSYLEKHGITERVARKLCRENCLRFFRG